MGRIEEADLRELLGRLAPAVFLATSAYGSTEVFDDISDPKVDNSILLNVEAQEPRSNTKVHVAVVEEWDAQFANPNSNFKAKSNAKSVIPDSSTNGSLVADSNSARGRISTEVAAAKPATKYCAVVAFRGTQPWSLVDWAVDLNFEKSPITWWPAKSVTGEPLKPHAHRGFLYAFESVTTIDRTTGKAFDRTAFKSGSSIIKTLDEALQHVVDMHNYKSQPANPLGISDLTRIVVCGHSLGGAMASICAVWMKEVLPYFLPEAKDLPISCVTTGSPRTGDPHFAAGFQTLMQNDGFECYRLVHNNDLVPAVPFSNWGFAHVGQSIWLQKRLKGWGRVYHDYVNQTMGPDLGFPMLTEANSRPPVLLSVFDHFEWRYNSCISLACTTTVPCTPYDYMSGFSQSYRNLMLPLLVYGGNAFTNIVFQIILVMNFVRDAVLTVIKKLPSKRLLEFFARVVTRYVIIVLTLGFSVPMYFMTHITYYFDG